MSRYLIKKDTDSDKIICIQYDLAGYKFHPKMNENAEINVKEVTVYDKNMIDNVITKKFERNYQKLYLLFLYNCFYMPSFHSKLMQISLKNNINITMLNLLITYYSDNYLAIRIPLINYDFELKSQCHISFMIENID